VSIPFLPSDQANGAALCRRAAAVIPGAIPGHQSPALNVPGHFPYFAKRGSGACYWDADDRRFIDFMGGYGPLVLGTAHPEVDAAYTDALKNGNCFNHPTEWTVRLAEALVERVDFADWAFFGKNGADMTYWAIRVAREHTHRPYILKVTGAYHGTEPWCSDTLAGVLSEDKAHILEIPWNDHAALEQTIQAKGDRIAGLVTTPFHHPSYGDMELPEADFLAALRRHCDAVGAVWILDDVRGGFRHDIGGSHRYFSFTPDISCYSKAIANGYALSAAVGREALRPAASRVFATGSFWNNPAPHAAALKTMEVLERDTCIPGMLQRGSEWIDAFLALGKKHGIELKASGTPTLPYIRIAEDPGFFKQQSFCSAAIRQGVFLHPHHNWFIGAAHDDALLEESLAAIDRALGGCSV
jgi:glutamate-1-semialdehyde 2,1-aminomutase